MSATEEIQAAIDKLTRLRAKSSRGPWAAERYDYGVPDEPERVRVTSPADDDEYNTAEGVLPEDAELIVTLHATIDAQLKILTRDLEIREQFAEQGIEDLWETAVERAGDLDLARAINGGA